LAPIASPITTAPINSAMKMPNRIFAILVEAYSTPVKPKIPATIAISRKTTAHFSICYSCPD
jgi:hypothetical protein